jgi:hypothetical protein
MPRELVKVMQMIEKIKNAIEKISESLPINADKFVEMFYDLTQCEISYDITPSMEKEYSLSENIDLRVYNAKDRVYCIENGIEKEYIVNVKVMDIFDKYKTIAIILEYEVLSIDRR